MRSESLMTSASIYHGVAEMAQAPGQELRFGVVIRFHSTVAHSKARDEIDFEEIEGGTHVLIGELHVVEIGGAEVHMSDLAA
jgi:hypothetical protein